MKKVVIVGITSIFICGILKAVLPIINYQGYLVNGYKQPKKWTIAIFMNADNNLESAAIGDINEMERGIDTSLYNVVVQIDRIPGYDNSNGDWTTTRRYYITPDPLTDTIIRSQLILLMG